MIFDSNESLFIALQRIINSQYVEPNAEFRTKLLQGTSRGQAAVCVLFSGRTFLESKILLTERSATLPTHAGQVAFPGGAIDVEDESDFIRTAFRECEEEVGISRELLKPIGVFPSFPTMTGGFEVFPVIAMLDDPLPVLTLHSSEVAHGEWVSVRTLIDSRNYEIHTALGTEISTPFFMWGERKMWGLSGWIFDLILNRYATIDS